MCKAVEDFAEKRMLKAASNLLGMGMTAEQISDALDIPVEKVLELKEQLVVA